MTTEELQAELDTHKARLADVMGEGGSYRTLQVQLDEQLELHKTKDAAHAEELAKRTDVLDAATKANANEVAALKAAHAAELKSQQEQFAKAAADSHAAHQAEMATIQNNLRNECAATIAQLKSEVLVPALKAEHARQAAAFAEQQAAELAKITG